ncbi:MAG: GNAT family N-acetyltransferase [Bryobacterales bacterium]|nr:GNAT family N-acetyltransferase [Bryobacterales bacterium]
MRLREATAQDLDAVWRINERSVPAANSLSRERLQRFAREAQYFRVAEYCSQIAGFRLCLAPEADYDSPIFRWLNQRYDRILYVDRVAVDKSFHGRGIARALYLDAAGIVRDRCRMIACEVNLRPGNDASLKFHERLAFRPVGTRDHGYVKVQYMLRELPF